MERPHLPGDPYQPGHPRATTLIRLTTATTATERLPNDCTAGIAFSHHIVTSSRSPHRLSLSRVASCSSRLSHDRPPTPHCLRTGFKVGAKGQTLRKTLGNVLAGTLWKNSGAKKPTHPRWTHRGHSEQRGAIFARQESQEKGATETLGGHSGFIMVA